MHDPFVAAFAAAAAEASGLPEERLAALVGAPKDTKRFTHAFPCFVPAKETGQKPPDLAAKVAERLRASPLFEAAEAQGPFVNARVAPRAYARSVIAAVDQGGARYGGSDDGAGRVVVLDYGSPNIAKRFHIGHLRSTVIGAALYRTFQALGYRAIGVNHLGDWGTQFGHLLSAWSQWGDDSRLVGDPIGFLQELYVKHNKLAKEDPAFGQAARDWFKRLEDGDPAARALWKRFLDLSLEDFARIYDLLGVRHDEVKGESFYAGERTEDAIRRCEAKGISRISEGALVVDFRAQGVDIEQPLLLKRSDGATLYATRDVAAGLYRFDTYDPARIIYVIGQEQRLAMQQLFATLRLLGYDASRCHHVSFGRVLGMSSREGTAVLLDEVLGRAIALARAVVEETNRDNPDPLSAAEVEAVAKAVGIGAVVFADLKNGLKKDFDFDWDRIVQLKGDTGPYLQYTHARLSSVLRKLAADGVDLTGEIDADLLVEPETQGVLRAIAAFPGEVRRVADSLEPASLCQYLLDLASAFNGFYKEHHVKNAPTPELTKARARLVTATRTVLGNGLRLLGLAALDRM